MSWLFKSLQSNQEPPESPQLRAAVNHSSSPEERSPSADRHALKDDVSVLFRGVANFLAPPPSSSSSAGDSPVSPSSKTLDGIKSDLVEIGGTFKSSLSLFSPNKVVTGISELASQLLQLEDRVVGDDREEGDGEGYPGDDEIVPGTTDEERNPQRNFVCSCYTNSDLRFISADFSMSNSQREHALTIEGLILEARDMLLQKLKEKRDFQVEECDKLKTLNTHEEHREDAAIDRENISSEKNEILTEKSNAEKGPEIGDTEEDVSFSDLEDDGSDLSDRLSGHRGAQDMRGSSPEGSSDWVRLSENSMRRGGRRPAIHYKGKDSEDESNDWLAVDDFN
ncbi:uncharacterized protein G2W53_038594 [Senna tora]|uniref:BSD domain-containing protein n=1 Tax=Senna tora TaxID=362788 RepID=A0A834W2C9_9FABA|nr:uncharacterized protein G2W53_038594 [Senna tora]